ncbi:hypothetical protein POV27_18835 [Aureisphaera galaxeae]|uniref:tetratricopeptide repeat protein n=1 Tax=Aureisphaera galaxeae TaxID=1538023 RepID=UPI002350EAEF|nr:hypothetical protein [Aureisphaera galaxeae]MDC8006116.1 hypothetical protein [Aureisphaera galaxeae]
MKIQTYLPLIVLLLLFGCKERAQETETVVIAERISLGCAPPVLSDKDWYKIDNAAPIIEGLDVLHFPVTTQDTLVQRYFNQGLILAYGFNHAEAARSFYYATKLDPNCAMAYWGYAYVLGPNYNAGMESDNYERAYDAIQKALELSKDNATLKEKKLIEALAKRYVKEPVADRMPLDKAYSKAMKGVFEAYPEDADVGCLYVESLMNLHPWDLWDIEGAPKAWTPKIISEFDNLFTIDSLHPGAHHFYIHAVEASASPERGLRSAQLYDDDLVPGAGHLVHMPSHIYIRTGDYHKGTLANIRSVAVDSSYLTTCHAQGTYPLTLYPHNYHFLAATATLEGNSELGIMAAQKVAENANKALMKMDGWGTIQHYYTIPYYVMVKFGKWEEILAMENKGVSLKYPDAIRHYAHGMAYVGLKDLDKAKQELVALQGYAEDKGLETVTIWDFNNVHQLLQIASRVLEADILASEGNYGESINLLKEAVALEDALVYQEPPDWFFSVRHNLGAIQLKAGNYEDAIATYEEDLKTYPKNGWSLHGLQQAYQQLNDTEKFSETSEKLETIWATADIELESSKME